MPKDTNDDNPLLDSAESINGLLGNTDATDDEPGDKTPETKPQYVSKADHDSLKQTIDKLTEKLEESSMELQYLRGRQSITTQERREESSKPEPRKKYEPDYDAVAKDIETRGPAALREFVDKLIEDKNADFEERINNRSQEQFRARDAGQRRAAMFQSELDNITDEFEDVWDNDEFKHDADEAAARILSMRTGMSVEQILSDPRTLGLYQPGDLYAAASRTYAEWQRKGKLKTDDEGEEDETVEHNKLEANAKPNSLREVARRVPRTDDLGNGNGARGKSAPKTIDELFSKESDRRVARAVLAKQKPYGVSEESYVKGLLAARTEHDDYVG